MPAHARPSNTAGEDQDELSKLVKRVSSLKALAAIGGTLIVFGALGLKAWMGKADAATVSAIEHRVGTTEKRQDVLEALQRAGFEQDRATQGLLLQVLATHNHPIPTPAAIATPTPLPEPHPVATATPQ